ncbi:MAG: GNAT family N-acetyltransferase [Alphaproteobacteria bacterium]
MRESKASWGYDADFLAHFAPSLRVTPGALTRRRCWAAVAGGTLLGYAALADDRLDDLFVAPSAMGRGVARSLLRRAARDALRLGRRRLVLDADPFAEGFYRRLGARRIGWTLSPWPGDPGRRLPRMALPCIRLR